MDTIQILTPLARQGIERALTHQKKCQERLDRAEAELVEALKDGWNVRQGTTVWVDGVPHTVTHVIPWFDDAPDHRPLLLGYPVNGGDRTHFIPLGDRWRTSVEMD